VEYSALVTDINLREAMDGWQLATAARLANPNLPVVYMTAGRGEEWAAHGVPNSILLQKPFAPAQLVTAVSQLLNKGTPASLGRALFAACDFVNGKGHMSLTGPLFARPHPPQLQMLDLKGCGRRRGSQGRVVDTGNEGMRRDHSGNPAFRRPSISSFEFDCPPRAMKADIVKAGSTSSRRAAASRTSASRPRWAKADARQR
jgi:hypothetical protein